MLKTAHKRYCAIYNAIKTDEEYLTLYARLKENEPLFDAVMHELTPDQQNVIIEHLGICAELSERTVEIACFLP